MDHQVIEQPCGCETVEGDGFLAILLGCSQHPICIQPQVVVGRELVDHFKEIMDYIQS